MRTRLIRPAYWSDSKMADLDDSTRLTYMGLWCLADDAGYFVNDAREIAAELYRYRATEQREAQVVDHLATLIQTGKIKPLACGKHAVVPSLPEHRIKGGQLLFTVQKKHETGCPMERPVGLRSPTETSVSVSSTDSVSETVSGAPAGAKKNGSSDPETDVERLARYRSLRDDPSRSADIRAAAKDEVERLERLVHA